MSEEKPVFKVTDRRQFNADGSPREGVERAEEPATPAAPQVASSVAEPSAAPPPAEPSVATAGEPTRAAASVDISEREAASAPPQGRSTTDDADADPTAFTNLLMFVASPAAAAMGMTEHPGLPAHEIDLPLAKHCIDLLATLRQKTGNNLSVQEEQMLEGLLAELRMQYVALTTARPAAGRRGFTGGDITGGR
jgi:hypothetical protein